MTLIIYCLLLGAKYSVPFFGASQIVCQCKVLCSAAETTTIITSFLKQRSWELCSAKICQSLSPIINARRWPPPSCAHSACSITQRGGRFQRIWKVCNSALAFKNLTRHQFAIAEVAYFYACLFALLANLRVHRLGASWTDALSTWRDEQTGAKLQPVLHTLGVVASLAKLCWATATRSNDGIMWTLCVFTLATCWRAQAFLRLDAGWWPLRFPRRTDLLFVLVASRDQSNKQFSRQLRVICVRL